MAMGDRWRGRLLGVLAGAVLATCAGWAMAGVEMRSDDEVKVEGSYDTLVMAAGDEVTLSLTSTDDVAAAGGDVMAQNATLDHAFLAGGDISFADSTAHDLFAAGGEIDLVSGQVADDVVAAGGRIKIARDARVDGDVVVSGGNVRLEGPIGGEVRAAGGTIYLSGPVVGDVYLDGGSITIGPDARIQGALTHRGRHVEISPQAQINGHVTALRPRPEINLRPLAAFGAWVWASLLFGLFLLAVVIASAFPRLMNDVAEAVRTRPLSTFVIGLLIAFFTPVVIIVLIVTLLGIPLAFVLGAAFALLWPVAIVGAVYAAGMWVRARMRAGAPAPSAGGRVLWAGIAMIVFVLAGLVPIVGPMIWWLAYLLGLGAVASQAGRALSKPAEA
jgi:cytoskeletal protein CcmA (bactofilin family)